MNLSQEGDCKKMVDIAVEKVGAFHVAFNNAGIFRSVSFADITEETIDELLGINVKSLAFFFKYQVRTTRPFDAEQPQYWYFVYHMNTIQCVEYSRRCKLGLCMWLC